MIDLVFPIRQTANSGGSGPPARKQEIGKFSNFMCFIDLLWKGQAGINAVRDVQTVSKQKNAGGFYKSKNAKFRLSAAL